MKKSFLTLTMAAILFGCTRTISDREDYVVIIHTGYGDMKAILYEETPVHKKNFIGLVRDHRYDSTTWHRVIEDFMIQGGDVAAREGTQENPADRLPAEIVQGFHHTKGALAAARQGDQQNPEKKSSATQFYIVDGRRFSEAELTTDQYKLNTAISEMLKDDQYDSLRQLFLSYQEKGDVMAINQLALDCKEYVEHETGMDMSMPVGPETVEIYTVQEGAPHLDHEYTIFGRVVEGLEVIDKIAAVETGPGDQPVKPAYLTMELQVVPKAEITEKYGYTYPEKTGK